jgi:hypothetical protein
MRNGRPRFAAPGPRALARTLAAAGALASACTGSLAEIYPHGVPAADPGPHAAADDGGAATSDGGTSQAPQAPTISGGGTPSATFAEVLMGMDMRGCTNSLCHGGTATPLHLIAMAATPADRMANLKALETSCAGGAGANSCIDVAAPASSFMLIKPTQTNITHGGGTVIMPSEPIYTRWLSWIQAGAAP